MAPVVQLPQPVQTIANPVPGSLAPARIVPQPPAPPQYRTPIQRLQDFPREWWDPNAKAAFDERMKQAKLSRYQSILNLIGGGLGLVQKWQEIAGTHQKQIDSQKDRAKLDAIRAELDSLDLKDPGAKDRVISLVLQMDPVNGAKLLQQEQKKFRPYGFATGDGGVAFVDANGKLTIYKGNSSKGYVNVLTPEGDTMIIPEEKIPEIAGEPGYKIVGKAEPKKSSGLSSSQMRALTLALMSGRLTPEQYAEMIIQSKPQTSIRRKKGGAVELKTKVDSSAIAPGATFGGTTILKIEEAPKK